MTNSDGSGYHANAARTTQPSRGASTADHDSLAPSFGTSRRIADPREYKGAEIGHGHNAERPLVLVVADHWSYAAAVEASLRRRGLRVVTAHDAATALRVASRRRPDIGVIDVNFGPVASQGVPLCEELRRGQPAMRFVVVTGESHVVDVRRALEIGVHAYIVKRDARDADRCAVAVETALAGDVTLDREIRPLVSALVQQSPDPGRAAGLNQLDVVLLQLLERGLPDSEIALQLGRSVQTVKNRNHAIYTALGAENRTAAVSEARRRGIIGR